MLHLSADLLAGGILTGLICATLTAGAAAQQQASPPDFSANDAGWVHFNTEFSIVSGAASPLHNDPAHPRVSNREAAQTGTQPTYFIADLTNPTILKPWVVERMRKDNAEVLAGKNAFTPLHSACRPAFPPFIWAASRRSISSKSLAKSL
jgi:hypothetical protein